MTTAVIFDLDGTLIDLPINYAKLFHEFSRIMKTDRVRPLSKTIPKLDRETKGRVFDVWESIELEALTDMTERSEGMNLYKKHVKKAKALVTMQGKTLVQRLTERLGLSFDLVITRECSFEREDQLRIAADRLGISLQKILFIGNTEEDAKAAAKAGCQFLKVGT